jgi:hypothetical protein
MRTCSSCQRERLTDGGVQMSPLKWFCQLCWLKFSLGRK